MGALRVSSPGPVLGLPACSMCDVCTAGGTVRLGVERAAGEAWMWATMHWLVAALLPCAVPVGYV